MCTVKKKSLSTDKISVKRKSTLLSSARDKMCAVILFVRPLAFLGIFSVIFCASLIALKCAGHAGMSDWRVIIAGSLAGGVMASAAHALNNIYDMRIDAINRPYRQLPSHRITLKEAWLSVFLLYGISALLATALAFACRVILSGMFILSVAYSHPFMRFKNNWMLSALVIALFRGLLTVLLGWGVVASLGNPTPWLIGMISFFFLLGGSATKDIFDVKGDREHDAETLAMKFGRAHLAWILAPFYTLPFLLIPVGVYWGVLPKQTLIVTLLFLYGLFTVRIIASSCRMITILETNHVSWHHTYAMYILYNLGMCIMYIVA